MTVAAPLDGAPLASLLIIVDGGKVGGKINITFRRRPRYFRREIFLARRSHDFRVIFRERAHCPSRFTGERLRNREYISDVVATGARVVSPS